MGDRVSISFKSGNRESVTFFSHWDGADLNNAVLEYLRFLGPSASMVTPLDRRQPNTVMLDFINWYFKKQGINHVESNYYLGANSSCGDNSDNGHYCYVFVNGKYDHTDRC